MRARKVFEGIFIAMLLIIVAFFAFRIFFMEDTSVLKNLYPTENAVKAYQEYGQDAFTYHNVDCDIASDGYYDAYAFVYNPSQKEVQVTAKYNDSLLTQYLAGADSEDFTWELRDENGETLSKAKIVDSTKKYYYNYVRLVFEDVEITDTTQLYLQLVDKKAGYPKDSTKVDNFTLYVYTDKLTNYKLSKSEIELLTK